MREHLNKFVEKIKSISPEYPDILIRRIAQLVQQIKFEESAAKYTKYGMNPWILKQFRCVRGENTLPEDEFLTKYISEINLIEIEY
jgi:hypothetical protein